MSDAPDFRDQFIQLLNDREKSREHGFVVLLHGAEDLAPLEEVCFSPDQTYNRCLTARYGAGAGDVLTPLFRTFLQDVRMLQRAALVKSASPPGSAIGQFHPQLQGSEWHSLVRHLNSMAAEDEEISPERLLSLLETSLQVGERLVFFCELIDVPKNMTLRDMGLDGEGETARLVSRLPRRVGLVLSGLPEGIRRLERSHRFVDLEAGPDYGTTGIRPTYSLPLQNDNPRGEDRLGILSEVHALADSIASKDLDPPLVVGILGGWGSGKSFILQLLQERLRFIRNMDLRNGDVRKYWGYVGHPYIVHFDAWTYAKSDLWASLMERILSDLDQQLDLEKVLSSELISGFDLWEILDCSTDAELNQLAGALGPEAIASIKDWKSGAGTAMALWGVLRSLHKEEMDELDKANKELARIKDDNATLLREAQIQMEHELLAARQRAENTLSSSRQVQQNELAQKQAQYAALQSEIDASVDQEIEKIARKEAWTPVQQEVESFFGAAVDGVLQEIGAKSGGAPVSVWMVAKEIGLARKYVTGLKSSPVSLAFLAFALVSGLAMWALSRFQPGSYFSSFAGFTSFIACAIGSGYTALTKVNRWFEEKQSSYEQKMQAIRSDKTALRESMLTARRQRRLVPLEREIQDMQTRFTLDIKAQEEQEQENLKKMQVEKEQDLEQKKKESARQIREAEEKVEEHRRRAGLPGQCASLAELIQKRIESGYYQKKLGVLHQVQKDLKEISDALLMHDVSSAEKLFPRGEPRIILMIDDLDRCPPRQVVQVLEAAQLLVKTRLFVVIIAMDVRYVTRALEKEYEGILRHDGHPSGLDYTEKIVQIPYRVRPIAPESMKSYLRSQVEVRAQPGEAPAGPAPAAQSGLLPATITAPGQASLRVNEALPPEVHMFEQAELDLLEAAAVSVEINPRATKRLVNVMKIIKSIWYRRGSEQPLLQVKQAMILLLTLSASYPETMARILDELEREYREQQEREEVNDTPAKLQPALQSIIQRWCSQEGSAQDWDTVSKLIANHKLLDPVLSLVEFELANLQIVRSFSFLGEVDMPVASKPQRHTVEVSPSITLNHP